MTRRNLEFYRGDTYPFTVDITNAGAPVDVTGYLFRMTAKYTVTDPDSNAVFVLTSPGYISVTNASLGEINVTIPPSATTSLKAKNYRLPYDIQMYNDPQTVYTVCSGLLNIFPDVSITTI